MAFTRLLLLVAAACYVTAVSTEVAELSQGRSLLQSTTVFQSISVVVPKTCGAVNVNSSLIESCGDANGNPIYCVTSSNTNLAILQRNTLHVAFTTGGGSYDIIGGSPTMDLQSDPVPDLTKDTGSPPSGSPGFVNATINGFYYTPKMASYPQFGSPGNNGSFAFYVIDTSRSQFTGGKYLAPACRFYMSVAITPMTLPSVSQDQLYQNGAGAAASIKIGSIVASVLGVSLGAFALVAMLV
jgi:hypothetical protein